VFLLCIYHSDNLMAYEYIDTLDANAMHRYKAKLATAGLSECPFRSPADQWRDNIGETTVITMNSICWLGQTLYLGDILLTVQYSLSILCVLYFSVCIYVFLLVCAASAN